MPELNFLRLLSFLGDDLLPFALEHLNSLVLVTAWVQLFMVMKVYT
jgi:hypothetical protein